MEIQLLQNLQQLTERAEAWNDLLKSGENQNPYMTLDWICAWWRFYGHLYAFNCIMFTEGDLVLGFLPLMAKKKHLVTEYRLIGTPQSSRVGFLVKPGFEKAVAAEALTWMKGFRSGAVFHLRGMVSGDICLETMLERISDRRHLLKRQPLYYIRLEQRSREDYFQHVRTHRTIRMVMNCEKSFDKILPLRFLPAAPEEVELIFPLHEKRWTRKNDGNGFDRGVSREFFTYLALEGNPGAAENPASFLTGVHLLWAGRLLIGFHYGFLCNGHYAFYRLAHDNDFGVISPGIMVVKNMIEYCYEKKLKIIDFSTGDEKFKQEWAEKHETVCRLFFGSNTIAANLVVTAEIWKERVRNRLKGWKKLVYFKRVTLGHLKYWLSGAPLKNFFIGLRRTLKNRSPGNYLRLAAQNIAQKMGKSRRLFKIEQENWKKPDGTGFKISPAELDRLEFLSDLTSIRKKDIVRRYKNREKCYLAYNGEHIAGFAWVSCTQIKGVKRTLWKSGSSCDRCIYEPCLLEGRTSRGKEMLCRMAQECAGAEKGTCVYLLVHRFDRAFLKAASCFSECKPGKIQKQEA